MGTKGEPIVIPSSPEEGGESSDDFQDPDELEEEERKRVEEEERKRKREATPSPSKEEEEGKGQPEEETKDVVPSTPISPPETPHTLTTKRRFLHAQSAITGERPTLSDYDSTPAKIVRDVIEKRYSPTRLLFGESAAEEEFRLRGVSEGEGISPDVSPRQPAFHSPSPQKQTLQHTENRGETSPQISIPMEEYGEIQLVLHAYYNIIAERFANAFSVPFDSRDIGNRPLLVHTSREIFYCVRFMIAHVVDLFVNHKRTSLAYPGGQRDAAHKLVKGFEVFGISNPIDKLKDYYDYFMTDLSIPVEVNKELVERNILVLYEDHVHVKLKAFLMFTSYSLEDKERKDRRTMEMYHVTPEVLQVAAQRLRDVYEKREVAFVLDLNREPEYAKNVIVIANWVYNVLGRLRWLDLYDPVLNLMPRDQSAGVQRFQNYVKQKQTAELVEKDWYQLIQGQLMADFLCANVFLNQIAIDNSDSQMKSLLSNLVSIQSDIRKLLFTEAKQLDSVQKYELMMDALVKNTFYVCAVWYFAPPNRVYPDPRWDAYSKQASDSKSEDTKAFYRSDKCGESGMTLIVKESQIQGAGLGLFLGEDIYRKKKKDKLKIIEYTGQVMNRRIADLVYGVNAVAPYGVAPDDKAEHVVDAYSPRRHSWGRYANDTRGHRPKVGEKPDAEKGTFLLTAEFFWTKTHRCYLVLHGTLDSLRAGTEIMVDYDNDYWKYTELSLVQPTDLDLDPEGRGFAEYNRQEEKEMKLFVDSRNALLATQRSSEVLKSRLLAVSPAMFDKNSSDFYRRLNEFLAMAWLDTTPRSVAKGEEEPKDIKLSQSELATMISEFSFATNVNSYATEEILAAEKNRPHYAHLINVVESIVLVLYSANHTLGIHYGEYLRGLEDSTKKGTKSERRKWTSHYRKESMRSELLRVGLPADLKALMIKLTELTVEWKLNRSKGFGGDVKSREQMIAISDTYSKYHRELLQVLFRVFPNLRSVTGEMEEEQVESKEELESASAADKDDRYSSEEEGEEDRSSKRAKTDLVKSETELELERMKIDINVITRHLFVSCNANPSSHRAVAMGFPIAGQEFQEISQSRHTKTACFATENERMLNDIKEELESEGNPLEGEPHVQLEITEDLCLPDIERSLKDESLRKKRILIDRMCVSFLQSKDVKKSGEQRERHEMKVLRIMHGKWYEGEDVARIETIERTLAAEIYQNRGMFIVGWALSVSESLAGASSKQSPVSRELRVEFEISISDFVEPPHSLRYPELHYELAAYFSREITEESLVSHVKIETNGNQVTVALVAPDFNDGAKPQFSTIGLRLYAYTHPIEESIAEVWKSIQKRTYVAEAFVPLHSLIEKGAEFPVKVSFYDRSYRLDAESKPVPLLKRGNFVIKRCATETDSFTLRGNYDDNYDENAEQVAEKIMERFFTFFSKSTHMRPLTEHLGNKHTKCFPGSPIRSLPSSLFVFNTPLGPYKTRARSLFRRCFDMSCSTYNIEPKHYVDSVRLAIESKLDNGDLVLNFIACIKLLFECITRYSNMCDYKQDLSMGVSCEFFSEGFEGIIDCEDSAKFAYSLVRVLKSSSVTSDDPVEYWTARVLEFYVVGMIVGSSVLRSKSASLHTASETRANHVFGACIPEKFVAEALKRGGAVAVDYKQKHWIEKYLPFILLEGTGITNPIMEPLDRFIHVHSDKGRLLERYKSWCSSHMADRKRVRENGQPKAMTWVNMADNTPCLYAGKKKSEIPRNGYSKFYEHAVHFWTDEMVTKWNLKVTDLMFCYGKGRHQWEYGAVFRDLVFLEPTIEMLPTYTFTDSEWDVLSPLIKQVYPAEVALPISTEVSSQMVTLGRGVQSTNKTHGDILNCIMPNFVSFYVNHPEKTRGDVKLAVERMNSEGIGDFKKMVHNPVQLDESIWCIEYKLYK